MNFEKYLKKKEIKKVVDPSVGDIPSAKPTINLPKEIKQQQNITKTELTVRVKDLIETSQQLQETILGIISNINEENKVSPVFVQYHKYVKDNQFNPASLINNPEARPTIVHQPNDIKALEREVYRTLDDPRAPFVQDLYNHLSDAGLSEYILTDYWQKMLTPNNWYDSYDQDNELARYSIIRESQHLDYLSESSDRIFRNTYEQLSYSFLKALSKKIISEIYVSSREEQASKVEQLITLLKQIRTVLLITSIINTEKWEQFHSNISDIYGDFLQLTAAKIARTSAYAFVGGIQDRIIDFTDGFDKILPLDLGLLDIPEAREFMAQIDSSFGYFLAQIEDDFVYREGVSIKLAENREILYRNSRKNSKTKQFLTVLASVIRYLEEVKYIFQDINSNIRLDIEHLAQSLLNNSFSNTSVYKAEKSNTL